MIAPVVLLIAHSLLSIFSCRTYLFRCELRGCDTVAQLCGILGSVVARRILFTSFHTNTMFCWCWETVSDWLSPHWFVVSFTKRQTTFDYGAHISLAIWASRGKSSWRFEPTQLILIHFPFPAGAEYSQTIVTVTELIDRPSLCRKTSRRALDNIFPFGWNPSLLRPLERINSGIIVILYN